MASLVSQQTEREQSEVKAEACTHAMTDTTKVLRPATVVNIKSSLITSGVGCVA